MVTPMPYPAIYELTAEGGRPAPTVVRSLVMRGLDEAAIEAILAALATATSRQAMVQLRVLGGAAGRVPVDATACAWRGEPLMAAILTGYEDPEETERHEAWTLDLYRALRPASSGAYVNFLDDEGDERVHEAYPGDTYQRLLEVKRRYDPANLFRLNQNIRP
jgi:FAD/FMN-containing dehydrogenase